jgi:hypothetical protein
MCAGRMMGALQSPPSDRKGGSHMAATHFDHLARRLVQTLNRRATLGLGAAGLLAALGLDDTDAKKHRKGKGKNKKKMCRCISCARCKNGKCKRVPAGTPCGDDKLCSADGQCLTAPALCQQRCGDCYSCLIKTDGSVICGGAAQTWNGILTCSSDSDCIGTVGEHCTTTLIFTETGTEGGFDVPRCASVSACEV